jgi:hypothetical protein
VGIVSDKIAPIMLFLIPILVIFLTATVILMIRLLRPFFRFHWIIAVGGMTLSTVILFILHFFLPQNLVLLPWQPVSIFFFSPSWLLDGSSWPYVISLGMLGTAVTWTAIVRNEKEPTTWAITLILVCLGILGVASGNALTLILVWTAFDLVELISLTWSVEGQERVRGVMIGFATRLAGTGLLIWATVTSLAGGLLMDFRTLPESTHLLIILACGLRLGIFPLHLPYRKENVLQRGFGTTLRLVSAAVSLALLARIQVVILRPLTVIIMMVMVSLPALYGGWRWLTASEEIIGRPYWILGMSSLAVAASLQGNPTGSIAWGIMLILGGGVLFLFSARQRSLYWLPLLVLWGLSSFPFSATAAAWQAAGPLTWLQFALFLPAQALLIAGFIRHALHAGETSLESQETWKKTIYPVGLFFLVLTALLLGVWGWEGAARVGLWIPALVSLILSLAVAALALTTFSRLMLRPGQGSWVHIMHLEGVYRLLSGLFRLLSMGVSQVTSALEGDGGLLWSLVLMVLVLSLLSSAGMQP